MDYKNKINSLLGEDLLIFKGDKESEEFIDKYNAIDTTEFDNKIAAFHEDSNNILYMKAIYKFAKCAEVTSVVELGTRGCYSSLAFLEAMGAEGELYSFDPVIGGNSLLKADEVNPRWNRYEKFDYDGYAELSDSIKNFDMLYIDTDPHSYDQLFQQLRNWWINNLKSGGYLLLDDHSPLHQVETFGNRPAGLFNVNAQFGTLRATLEFIEERYDDIHWAFSVENNYSNGIAIIKFK